MFYFLCEALARYILALIVYVPPHIYDGEKHNSQQ